MTEKLSDFTASTPSLTDYIAGATLGSPNKKFLISDISTSIPATGSLIFYVATTGSDSNPGTLAQPFATIQHALSVAGNFDYESLFNATINVAAGTYTITTPLLFPQLTNTSSNIISFLNGAAQATCFINAPNGTGVFKLQGPLCNWNIDGFTIDTAGRTFEVQDEAILHLDQHPSHITIGDHTSNNTFTEIFNCYTTGRIVFDFALITITTNNWFSILSIGQGQARVTFLGTGFVIPAGGPYGAANVWFYDAGIGNAIIDWSGIFVVTNFASFVGGRLLAFGTGGLVMITANGTLNDVPGNTSGSLDQYDPSVEFLTGSTTVYAAGGIINSGAPTTTNVAQVDSYSVMRDSSNGPRSIVYNNGGVIYTRQIGNNINTQIGAAYTLALSDQEGIVEMNNAGANTLTVPLNATVAFPLGTKVSIEQVGAGNTTIAGAGGVTVHNAGALAGQYKTALLRKRGTDEWTQTNGAF